MKLAQRTHRHALHWLGSVLIALAVTCGVLIITAPESNAPPADTLVVALNAEPKSLDPHVVTSLNDFRVCSSLYEGLVQFREGTLEIVPELATSWTISEDGQAYTFELRKDVVFHDGSRFDADAVKFNFDRMLDSKHPYHHTGPFPLSFFFEKVQRVEVLAPQRVRFHLHEPFAPLLSNLAYPTGLLVSPAAVKRWGHAYGRHPSGTGPFEFQDWQSQQAIRLRPFDEHRSRTPGDTSLVFRPIGDEMTRTAELRAGGLDLVTELPPDTIGFFRKTEQFVVHEQVGPHLWFIILNTKVPPFDDLRMRQAVNYAVDKHAIVEHVLSNTASVATSAMPRAFGWAHDPSLKPYPHDPQRARQLIREAGHENAELILAAPHGGSGMLAPVQMAQAIQADLAEVGLTVRLQTYEWNAYLDRVNPGLGSEIHMAEMAWMVNDPDTLTYLTLRSKSAPPEGFNSGFFESKKLDKLIQEGRRTTNRRRRAEIYQQIDRLSYELAPWLYVASWKQNAVARRRVRGFSLEPSFLLRLEHAFKEK